MVVAFDKTGSATGNAVTSLSIDITTAAVGAVVFCWIYNGTTQFSVSFPGWNLMISADESTNSHYSLWWRLKLVGDTTFAPNWSAAEGSSAVWQSYTGLNIQTPYEGLATTAITTSGSTQTTTSVTPIRAEWAVCFYAARSGAGTFSYSSADGAQTLRAQTVNSTSHWAAAMGSDSNGNVTANTGHTYTATLSSSQSDGATAVFLLLASITPPPVSNVSQAVQRASAI